MEFAGTIRGWLSEGHVVIADRYVYSNIAFQCAKCTDGQDKVKLREWILDLEYTHFQIPKPDISLYLDVSSESAATAIRRDATRDERNYLNGAQDIHESNTGFQEKVQQEYLSLVNTQDDFQSIPCIGPDHKRLSPAETLDNVISKLKTMHIV